MIAGASKIVIEVDDQDRAKHFWIQTMGFDLVQDTAYGEGQRWLEVRTPDKATILVLSPRTGEPRSAPDGLPTANPFFYCADLQRTYQELTARGVSFPQPPMELPFGLWSLFVDTEGNRFALVPRDQ